MPRQLSVLSAGLIVLAASFACGGGGGGQRLLIMDQNVLHGIIDEDPAAEPFDRFPERLDLIARALGEAKPDVVVLQEVVSDPGPDYPNVRETILTALGSDYKTVFGNQGGEPIDTAGLGQMTFTRLPIISSENRRVSQIRSVHHVALQTDDGVLDVYNAHLEGTGAVIDVTGDASVLEIQNILDFVNETRDPNGVVVIGGDFNAEPGDPAIQTMLDAGFIDTLAAVGDATCEQTGDPGCTSGTIPLGDNDKNLADHRIDYLFVLGSDAMPVTVKDAALWDNAPVDIGDGHLLWPSDHIGTQATVELGK